MSLANLLVVRPQVVSRRFVLGFFGACLALIRSALVIILGFLRFSLYHTLIIPIKAFLK